METGDGGTLFWNNNGESDVKYTQGVLAIDAYDVNRSSPIWHWVEKKRLFKVDMKDDLAIIKPAVYQILESFYVVFFIMLGR